MNAYSKVWSRTVLCRFCFASGRIVEGVSQLRADRLNRGIIE
jgi:hypothetical protein